MANESVPLDRIVTEDLPLVRLQNDRLNRLVGRLIVPHQMSVVYGPDRGILTLFAHVVLMGGVTNGSDNVSGTFFLDSGNNYSPALTRRLCPQRSSPEAVLANITFARVLSLDDVVDVLKRLSQEYHSALVVIDSLSGVLNLTESPGSKERARCLFTGLETIRHIVNSYQIHVLMTDYITRDWSTGAFVPIGGNVLSHSIDTLIRIDKLEYPTGVLRLEVERSPMRLRCRSLLVRSTPRGLMAVRQ